MTIRFDGWELWQGLVAALLVAAGTWLYYRRERRADGSRGSRLLRGLRTAFMALGVFILTGPVLHSRTVTALGTRVLVFIDGSASMRLTDQRSDAAHRILTLLKKSELSHDLVDTKLVEAAEALGSAREEADKPGRTTTQAADAFAGEVLKALGHFSKVRRETAAVALRQTGTALCELWGPKDKGDTPGERITTNSFEVPDEKIVSYTARLRGYVHPPSTGEYIFWIAGFESQLWLSTDDTPERKVLIAQVKGVTAPQNWNADPAQKSEQIHLAAGQKYYIEAAHPRRGGDAQGYLAVGWQCPNGTLERPIPGRRLSTDLVAKAASSKVLETTVARFREDLVTPVQEWVRTRGELPQERLSTWVATAARWDIELREAFSNYADSLVASKDEALQAALQKWEPRPRIRRVESILLDGQKGLLRRLAEKHQVEVHALIENEARPLWSSPRGGTISAGTLPSSLPLEASGQGTNLSDGVLDCVRAGEDVRTAVVLFSDGQHNMGSPPLGAAKILGTREIPIYTIGLGNPRPPADLNLVQVVAPHAVFYKDSVRGEIVLRDDMPTGQPFDVAIECEGQTLWEKHLLTEQGELRSIPYEFSVKDVVEKKLGEDPKALQYVSFPLWMRAKVSVLPGEQEKDNNTRDFHIGMAVHRRKVLLLEERPRWEFRYLRNLLQRDELWDVNRPLLESPGGWYRGIQSGTFPKDRETLLSYDLIVLGEVPPSSFTSTELEWMREFVEKRRGGLIWVDGQRGLLQRYADTPLGPVLPVEWEGEPLGGQVLELRPTPEGARGALDLSTPAQSNDELWKSFPPMQWVNSVRTRAGSETLLEAVTAGRRVPALVARRVGAGRSLYAGFDETWRWRSKTGDFHQGRYWNQLVRWTAEPPFAARDEFIMLDAGATSYTLGQSAEIRVRLRDGPSDPKGAAVRSRVRRPAPVEVIVSREGKRVMSIKLTPSGGEKDIYTGHTGALREEGRYEVRVRVEGLPGLPEPGELPEKELKARVEFEVRARDTGELNALHCNEELLRKVAALSKGEFFREEDAEKVLGRLDPMRQEQVIEREIVLWHSWYWFAAMLVLITAEWVVRKWSGML
jgi:hypothetical protein